MFTAIETVKKIKNGTLKAQEAVGASLAIIKERDCKINAFLEVFEEDALKQAQAVDAKYSAGKKLGLLAGVPVAIKDNLLYKGHRMTCASKILEGYICPYTATAVEKLIEQDAVIIGRTNMDEFAMGSSCENSAYKKTLNPLDSSRVPGGSSGGSAAAVAAGMAPLALGSDTGGSVRQPASFCGIIGMKPTYGLVSRYGLTAFASSLDQIGPFASTVEDCGLLLSAIAGHDGRDSTSANRPVKNFIDGMDSGIKGLKIGLPKEYFSSGLDPEIEGLIRKSADELAKQGAEILEVSLPHTEYAVSAYYILASSEASANLARFDGIRYGLSAAKNAGGGMSLLEAYEKSRGLGFGAEVKRRIMLGTYSLSSGYYDAYYGKAQSARRLIKQDFMKAFELVDIILGPTSPTAAFKTGEKISDPVQMYLSDIYTIPCNLAGIGGISIPCGRTSSGLPAGMQMLCRPFEEDALLRTAKAYENNSNMKTRLGKKIKNISSH